jgi:5'-phosphate synthase pdxT subunit
LRVGVFALQGDVREHLQILSRLGAETSEIRDAKALEEIDGLVIPGGESTTMSKLIDIFQLRSPLQDFVASGKPVFGTCAGMIMLATEVLDAGSGQRGLGAMDIAVRRNAFGTQLDSFETELTFAGKTTQVAFIRAPIVEVIGEGVEVLSTLEDGRIVGVRQGNLLATSFHPELTGDTTVHNYFLGMISSQLELLA